MALRQLRHSQGTLSCTPKQTVRGLSRPGAACCATRCVYCIIYRCCVQGGGGDPVAAVRREIEAQMRAKMQRDHSDAAMQRAREEAEAQARCARHLEDLF